ncbi:MAG: iron ABC transporter permease, partial [Clostridia bacterium]|nr:iron ABC transporter permease [Clostridia bacterium]
MNIRKRTIAVLLLSFVLLFAVISLALTTGRYRISLRAFFEAIVGQENREIERSIILHLRLPRTLVAILVGISLSLSGLLYQETFQNMLVSPDLLGVSGGAGVGAAIAIVAGFSAAAISAFAFVFGIGTVILTVLVSRIFRDRSSMTLVLSGIIVGGLAGACLSFVKYMADTESTLASITFWLMGSFEESVMKDVWLLLPIVAVCLVVSLAIRWRVNIVALGYEEAQTKGIRYRFYRGMIIVMATLLTAGSVAVAGTIGWIGLVVPHIVRIIVGRNTARTIPLTIMFGAIFMVLADVFARTFTAAEIPLSAVTGLFGTVVFVAILLVGKRGAPYHD